MKTKLAFAVSAIIGGLITGCVASTQSQPHIKGTKFGAPTEGMSTEEYQSLVFLDPQNTIRSDWHAVKGMSGYFLIDNQGEPTVSVVDYNQGETIKKIQMKDPEGTSFQPGGNHHIFVIPGARYAWSSQRYEKDVFWTIDLTTQEVVDTFRLSMNGKTVIAPLHIGFAYTQPLAVTGNILDKKKGYLTLLSTATRRPVDIIELSCPGARDAMFTLDDSKIFTTCQQEPKGVSIVDVKTRKEIKMVPIKGGRAGGMTPDGKYFMVGATGAVVLFDTATGCYNIAPLRLLVLDTPQISDPSPLVACDADGVAVFDLTEAEAEILAGLTGGPYVVEYFEDPGLSVAITNTTAPRFTDMIDDRVQMATFLHMGMNATPAAQRLELPAWVLELSQAAKKEADMGRAKGIARGVIEG